MNQPIKLLTEVEYFRDQRPWVEHRTASPTWHDVEAAVRRMDNYCFPFVQLYPTEHDEAEDTLYIIGGGGRYAMSDMMGVWQYVDETRGDAPVHLWESDQGYECRECNISTDIAKVLRIAKHFYETGSYAQLDAIE
jgi:hypothetical protein